MVDKSKVSASAIKSSVTTYLVQMLLQLFLLKGLHPSHWTQSVRLHGELLADLLHEGDVSQVEQGALGRRFHWGNQNTDLCSSPSHTTKLQGVSGALIKCWCLLLRLKSNIVAQTGDISFF